ncbi:hypothetical protein AWB80_01344 [Caballeronia pedi]|uniref:Uncharacterized protein n=1 Tax=Caballeronia pedi TaxID=1777141 RepID=A0A157ZV99_9BURK|nr:hypothetical protein [Caballeronia pedi]SAK49409.1 hypothetical protein AWB80_01344 [Caballeronia pedi]
MDTLANRFDALANEMNEFYSLEFLSDYDEYEKNKKIKSNIIQLIIDAENYGDTSIREGAVNLLFDNTGCQEDFEILEQLFAPLFASGILDKKLLEDRLKQSPLSRWS